MIARQCATRFVAMVAYIYIADNGTYGMRRLIKDLLLCGIGDFKEWQMIDLVVTAVACEFWGSCGVSFYWRPVLLQWLGDGNVDAANGVSFVLLFGVVSLDVFWSWLWSVCGVFSWFGGVVRKTPPFLAFGSSCVFLWLDDPACALSRTSKYQIMTPVVETNNYQRTIQTHGLYI